MWLWVFFFNQVCAGFQNYGIARGDEPSSLPLCCSIHCSQDKVEYQQAGTTLVDWISFGDPLWQEDAIHFQNQFLILPRKLTCSLKNSGWKTIISFWNDPYLRDMSMFVFGGVSSSEDLQAMSLMWSYVPGLVFIDSSHWTVASMWWNLHILHVLRLYYSRCI